MYIKIHKITYNMLQIFENINIKIFYDFKNTIYHNNIL